MLLDRLTYFLFKTFPYKLHTYLAALSRSLIYKQFVRVLRRTLLRDQSAEDMVSKLRLNKNNKLSIRRSVLRQYAVLESLIKKSPPCCSI